MPCLRPCRTWRWPSRIKTTIHILAIGSSSTFGIGASTLDRTYPFQLQDILEKTFKGHDVYISNSGTSGELAAATAERVKTEVGLKQPDLVLWQVGTNDVLAGVSVEDFRAIVQSTIQWLKERRIDTALIGLQYSPAVERGEHHKAIGRVIFEIAAAENVLLVRRYDAMHFLANNKLEELLSEDELHQNDLGYRCMAEHIARRDRERVPAGAGRAQARSSQSRPGAVRGELRRCKREAYRFCAGQARAPARDRLFSSAA